MNVLQLENVSYHYAESDKMVLENLSYIFENGKVYSIVGRSGAGKTTLLSLLSGLAQPTEGRICLNGNDIRTMDQYEYRSQCVGVIFQSFNLLPKLTAAENVELSMEISGKERGDKKAHALELLKEMGLNEDEAGRRVLKLSGGQQQRVAIARALSYNPEIILDDEPTGNLDHDTQEEIMHIFRKLAHEEGKCVILVTHSVDVAIGSEQVYEIGKGVIGQFRYTEILP